jgi:hypothetical protein
LINCCDTNLYQLSLEIASQIAQSQIAQSQIAQSQIAQSQIAQSQIARSQIAQSQIAQSQIAQSQVAQSQTAQSVRSAILDEVTSQRSGRTAPCSASRPATLPERERYGEESGVVRWQCLEERESARGTCTNQQDSDPRRILAVPTGLA